MAKQRIDVLLVEKGFFSSREKARAAVMAGQILANRERIDKAGTTVDEEAVIEIKGTTLPYVSRGGLKLEKAIQLFGLTLSGAVCADIGASTGGFTDCMLQNGAQKVYAIDVGYGQLDWKLRNDPRVVVMERTNIRNVTADHFSDPLDFISVDVSFISLKLVLPVIVPLLAPEAKLVALIKPQFEAGREQVGKGVIRNPAVHQQVISQVIQTVRSLSLSPEGISHSPIRGPKGNIEFLLMASCGLEPLNVITNEQVAEVVRAAHQNKS